MACDVELEDRGLRLVYVANYDPIRDCMVSRLMTSAQYHFSRMPRLRNVKFNPARLPI